MTAIHPTSLDAAPAVGIRTWRATQWPERERRDAWLEAISRTHLPWRVAAADTPPGLLPTIIERRIDELSLVDCAAGPCSGRRGRREIAATERDLLGVLVVLVGRERVAQDGRETDLGPGGALVWDPARPVRFAVPGPLVKRTLLLPRARIAALLPRGAGAAAPLRPGPATRLFTDYLAVLSRTTGTLTGPAAAAAANAAMELLAAAAAPGATVSDATAWEQVRHYVEAHLTDPDLRPGRIATANALSLRSLYLLLERQGETVGGYVRRRRLARAHAELARLGLGTTVAAVARRWGFADQTGFARAFKRQYGTTPDDVRRGRGGPAPAPHPPADGVTRGRPPQRAG